MAGRAVSDFEKEIKNIQKEKDRIAGTREKINEMKAQAAKDQNALRMRVVDFLFKKIGEVCAVDPVSADGVRFIMEACQDAMDRKKELEAFQARKENSAFAVSDGGDVATSEETEADMSLSG